MLGQYTFGLKPIAYSDIAETAHYFGDAVGGKTTASDAGALDMKAGNQFYSNKARFNIFGIKDVAPVDNGGTKGKVTITPTVTTAGAGILTLKVAGKEYDIELAATDTTATLVVTAIKNAVNDDYWIVSGTSTAVFEQRKAAAYTYAASDWASTFTPVTGGNGSYSTSAAKTTDAVAPTAYGITFVLQHCDTKDGTFVDLVTMKMNCEDLEAKGTPCFEITVPSTCKRFVRLKVTADEDATDGQLLCAFEPKN